MQWLFNYKFTACHLLESVDVVNIECAPHARDDSEIWSAPRLMGIQSDRTTSCAHVMQVHCTHPTEVHMKLLS